MNLMYKLSVLVPVYNVEMYLRRCLDSITNQTYKNLEIILVDDGSTDSSGIICDEYAKKDTRIKVIHKKNGGVTSARHIGIENATGSHITFVDSDDWIEIDAYERLLSMDEEIDIVVGSLVREENGNLINVLKKDSSQIYSSEEAIKEMLKYEKIGWSLCDKIYNAKLFAEEDFLKINVNNGEDLLENWNLFRRAKKIFYNPIGYYHYVERKNSITTSRFNIDNISALKIWDIMIKNIGDVNSVYMPIVIKKLHREYIYQLEIVDAFPKWEKVFEKYRDVLRKYSWIITKQQLLVEQRFVEITLMPYKEMLQEIEILVKELKDFVHAAKNIYIYGAGVYGKIVKDVLNEVGIKPTGFIITKGDKREYCDLPVYLISEFQNVDMSDSAVVLGLSSKYTDEVKSTLAEFDVVPCYDASWFANLYKIWLHSKNKVSVK